MLELKNKALVEEEIVRLKKITRCISLLRLVIALLLITFLICLFSLGEGLYGLLSILMVIIFVLVFIFTDKYFKALTANENKKRIIISHERKRKGELNHITDNGSDFITKNDYKLTDLDVFGSKSLFQYLSSARTKAGRDMLAKQLSDPIDMPEGFTNGIYELGDSLDAIDLQAALLSFNDEYKRLSYKELFTVVDIKTPFKPIYLLPLILFVLMIVGVILTAVGVMNPYILIIFPFLNFILAKVILKNDIFSLNSAKYKEMLDNYLYFISEVEKKTFNNSYLNELKEKLVFGKPKLKNMNRVFSLLASRQNAVFNIALNAIVVYDFWVLILFNRLNKTLSNIEDIINSTAIFEVMLSFANIRIDNEATCIPEKGDVISGVGLYHPLVKGCVSNDFTLTGGVILTGSNMSGKTTFMRTLGINQLLFNASSIVFAEKFSSTKLPIFTSLRANDMLQEGISTFYAEILRMKAMNEAINKGKCLILVDEIFKGTNAYERIEGSKIVISKFNEKKVLFIVSTHDFELCDCPNILNYHFNEEYHNDEISFDYRIKPGKCESTNALYLLKLSNII